jgi:hypothetical protein
MSNGRSVAPVAGAVQKPIRLKLSLILKCLRSAADRRPTRGAKNLAGAGRELCGPTMDLHIPLLPLLGLKSIFPAAPRAEGAEPGLPPWAPRATTSGRPALPGWQDSGRRTRAYGLVAATPASITAAQILFLRIVLFLRGGILRCRRAGCEHRQRECNRRHVGTTSRA